MRNSNLSSELGFWKKKAEKLHKSVEKWTKIQENQGKLYVTIPQPLITVLWWL